MKHLILETKEEMRVTAKWGRNIHDVTIEACSLAKLLDEPVILCFNGVTLVANPKTSASALEERYLREK